MAVNDPIGDLITRIRNAGMRKKSKLSAPNSRLRASVLEVLKSEGYIRDFATVEHKDGRNEVEIELKYFDGAAGDPRDRARLEARPPRLCVGEESAAGQ